MFLGFCDKFHREKDFSSLQIEATTSLLLGLQQTCRSEFLLPVLNEINCVTKIVSCSIHERISNSREWEIRVPLTADELLLGSTLRTSHIRISPSSEKVSKRLSLKGSKSTP